MNGMARNWNCGVLLLFCNLPVMQHRSRLSPELRDQAGMAEREPGAVAAEVFLSDQCL